MKNEILLELAKKWECQAEESLQSLSTGAREKDNLDKGRREGKRECADSLRTLVQLFPESFVKQTK